MGDLLSLCGISFDERKFHGDLGAYAGGAPNSDSPAKQLGTFTDSSQSEAFLVHIFRVETGAASRKP